MQSLVEEWRPVKGYEGEYEVSNHGNVRSLDRRVKHGWCGLQTFRGRVLKLNQHSGGYLKVKLRGGKQEDYAHRLVAKAFIGDPPEGMTEVNHKNGIKTDNRVENLEWCSRQGNVDHAVATGLVDSRGDKSCHAKYRDADVRRAWDMVFNGASNRAAAEACGIPVSTVQTAVRGARAGYGRARPTWGQKKVSA